MCSIHPEHTHSCIELTGQLFWIEKPRVIDIKFNQLTLFLNSDFAKHASRSRALVGSSRALFRECAKEKPPKSRKRSFTVVRTLLLACRFLWTVGKSSMLLLEEFKCFRVAEDECSSLNSVVAPTSMLFLSVCEV